MQNVLNLLLTHEPPAAVAAMIDWWQRCVEPGSLLVGYGGTRAHFEGIAHGQKVFIDDPQLRTSDHQRQMQSYTPVWKAASGWMREGGRAFTHVHFAEYDHVPLVKDLNARQVERLRAEDADVIAHRLVRIDGTSHPHYLYHTADPRFGEFWRKVTCRENAAVVLSMFGSGSVWTREAFDAVASFDEPFPMYLEVYLPTLAHHLGYRARDSGEQNRFVRNLGDLEHRLDDARAAGAWTAHPVKRFWSPGSAARRSESPG